MKKHFLLFSILFAAAALFAEKTSWKGDDYQMYVYFNQNTQPGDAIFVRLIFETKDKKILKAAEKNGQIQSTGKMQLFSAGEKSEKDISHAVFYPIKNQSTKKMLRQELLAGVPLSSYQAVGDYNLLISYAPFGKEEFEFSLPIKITEKEFVKETIPLDAKNTAIKTNDSDERWRQIQKLNAILETKNMNSVYNLSRFLPPTTATRRTSFFADRRIYAYSNGKSSTSLHYGIDYGIPTGSEVRACGDGKVVMAEFRISTGWSTVIEHLPGLYSLYYHQSELKCGLGDIVKKGDLIGLSGATGLATGPHLHWEMRLNMEAVSPDFFVNDFTFEEESKQGY
ncbi:MAG: M23 family metallopeptidase [Treponema sp.]|nr:M23 family metallopeptidase [Treponema sp.]